MRKVNSASTTEMSHSEPLTTLVVLKDVERWLGASVNEKTFYFPEYMIGLNVEQTMKAVRNPEAKIIGVCAKDDDRMDSCLETVVRRVKRDGLFDVIVTLTIREKKPNLIRIQQAIAHQLGFNLQEGQQQHRWGGITTFFAFLNGNTKIFEKAVAENARKISNKICTQPKILFIFRDLYTKLDLVKLGVSHERAKYILTSHSKDIVSSSSVVEYIE